MAPLRVSIIVNNYNYARFVEAAVDSALAQTYPCEVIVVDDGSTDGSKELLEKYNGRAHVILKENGGQISAFNVGFAKSTGSLVAFLDADDELFPEAMKTAVDAWEEGAAKVQFPLEILNAKNVRTGMTMPRTRLSRGNLVGQLLETGRYVASPTSGNLFSRDFLNSMFPILKPEWPNGDGYLNYCSPFHGTVLAIDRPLGFYRIHGESMSSVAHDGSVDLQQIEKLMREALAGKSFLERIAREYGYKVSKRAVVSHWIHLKLSLSFCKLSSPPGLEKTKMLAGSALAMFVSVAKSKELSLVHKLQHVCWAFGVAALPFNPAKKLIWYAFDTSARSGVTRLLRKA